MQERFTPGNVWGQHRGCRWLGAALAVLVLVGCVRHEEPVAGLESSLAEIKNRGVLRVITRYAPTTLYEGPDRRLGFEYELADAFARSLGVTPRFIILDGQKEILAALRNQEGDVAAAGLIHSQEMEKEFLSGPVYQEVDQQVVCRRGGRRPTNLLKLAKVKVAVPRGSSYEARLQELSSLVPEISWLSDPERSSEQIFEQVANGAVDCTVADSNVVAVNRRYYPELVVKFPINATQTLAWMLPRASTELQQEVTTWFAEMGKSGRLAALEERYFGYFKNHQYDYVDNRDFIRRIDDRLPEYLARFKDAGKRYGVPWSLLAAVAYQESNWDPEAISPTGVKGIMMLTQETAATLGVKNRKNPRESILAGAWYLAELRRRLPPEIKDPDRTWIALAAYNAGPGHVLDARDLVQSMGKDPNSWYTIREALPLLANKDYYTRTKHGYAPGMQPVRYVRKVRYYYDVLVQREAMLTQQASKLALAQEHTEETTRIARLEDSAD
ncbi:MAG: membrane-bound lytic murein transglycosylase MltF [Magnetococcales bacterium]|nr:membrane-bound lytic murein transglycosylase MltF [Magnetococcales bacterium]